MKRPLLLAGVLTVTIAVGGCSAGKGSAEGAPAKNLEQWALPLDQYAAIQTTALRDYAENLMVARCLSNQGVEWPVPWRPLDAPAVSASYSTGGARLFDENIATKYGYHRIPIVYEGKAEVRKASDAINALAQRDPSIDEKSNACLEEARKTIPVPPVEDYNYATVSAVAIDDASLRDATVLAATRKWRDCINRAGLGGLADSPQDMPGDAKSDEWRLGEPSDPVPISPEEIRTATADAKCRTSSHWSQALYDADYTAQVAFVKKNADKLNRIRDELAKDKERLLAAATKYAPK